MKYITKVKSSRTDYDHYLEEQTQNYLIAFFKTMFYKLNLTFHSNEPFYYDMRETPLPPVVTGLHKHVCLSDSESWNIVT